MKISLQDLLPAKVADEQPTPKEVARSRHDMRVIRAEARTRLIAQEYVRNGMNLVDAYNTVEGTRHPRTETAYRLLGKNMDVFVEELNRLLARADISRDRSLAILWAMVNASVLDYLDDNGHTLPVKELKKLPRIMQLLISEIEVSTKEEIAKGEDGKPLMDDLGRPYLLTRARVKVKIPDKLTAFRQLAEVMRWIGPSVQINNISIGLTMAEADAQRSRIEQVYDGEYREVRKE